MLIDFLRFNFIAHWMTTSSGDYTVGAVFTSNSIVVDWWDEHTFSPSIKLIEREIEYFYIIIEEYTQSEP